jgi:phenylalanyl-tRNA synthetase alpha chain
MSGDAVTKLIEDAAALAASARDEVRASADLAALAAVRARYAGKNGSLKGLLKSLSAIPKEDRSRAGKAVNDVATEVETLLDARKAALEDAEADGPPDLEFDPTLPGTVPPQGSIHPVTIILDEIRAIFTRMGFDEVSGPEVEDAWHNFDALNIPAGHPAREMTDQFYVEGGRLIRSQTSTVQVRVMETRKPPLRVFAPGRVYRPETVDARHLYAFHQVEGLVVDEGISFADLKGCIDTFAKSMYGPGVVTRFRPHNFPFTEVSAELDVLVRTPKGDDWMEVLGCGMVHPRVLSMCGIDPERWSGFAFGLGVERVAMRRWQLDDIRMLEENDVRFLAQFA